MANRFPKPSFDALVLNYNTEPETVHDCPLIHTKHPINVNTCAIRMSEALVIANGLVESREAIAGLARSGNGKRLLMGKYGYAANLCPHGIARGARDLADFLRAQWGTPSLVWTGREEVTPPPEVDGLTGLVAFIKLRTYDGQGHVDVWNQNDAVGHAYWDAQRIYLWKLA